MFPVFDGLAPSFFPLQDSSGLLAHPTKHLARLLSLFVLSVSSPPISVYSADPLQRLVTHRMSVGKLPTLRQNGRPNFLSWFPVQLPICRFAPPPRPVRLVVLGLGVGGGVKETAPPAMVLSPSSRQQASPGIKKCVPTIRP